MTFLYVNRIDKAALALAIAATAIVAMLVAFAAQARAEMSFVPGSFEVETYGADGTTIDSRAGGHPAKQVTYFEIEEIGPEVPSGRLSETRVDLPPGFVGDNSAVPKCPRDKFDQMIGGEGMGTVYCPPGSQVGLFKLNDRPGQTFAVYNVEPQAGVLADIGMVVYTVPVHVLIRIDPVTRGLIAEVHKASEGELVVNPEVTLWGDPASPEYDWGQRGCGETYLQFYCPVATPRKPFITNPSTCGSNPQAFLAANSWSEPENWVSTSYVSPEPIHGCDLLVFKPTLDAAPASSGAEAASGFSVHLDLPQNSDPDGLGTPPLKTARVVLPEGMSINPASADGLGSCADAQLGLRTDSPIGCPENSKLGTVTAKSPSLENPVHGSVYLRSQNSNDPESGEMFRLALVLEDKERGLLIKQLGQIKVNKNSGRIETIFTDNPQLPVSSIDLNLKSGPRAALQTPKACGTYATDYVLTSWGGQEARGQSKFTIDQSCGNESKFTPGFEAGTTNPMAGSHSPFTLRVTRPDGQQNVASIQTTLPEGLLAKLAGVPLCGDADANTGNCPSGSEVGKATVGSGAGSNPLYVPQPGKSPTAVYLAGPYKGAPYSLIAKVPAQAGPFDLGTVAVRNTINVDSTTAQVSVKSDPLPQILQGIPIAYRDIRVDVDRSQFTLNPTSCDPMEVKGTIGSAQGTDAKVADRFQVAGCGDLGFKPKLQLSVKGPTHRSAHPRLKAVLTMPKGGANIARAQVTLPKTEILAQEHIRTICTRVQYNAGKGGGDQCPKASVYGKARVFSTLLDKPLEGPVFLRSSSNELPDLVASLDGQIHVDLVGRIDAVNARIRNTFEGVPDAPVSKFVLEMQGGKKGLLVNNTELCKTTPRATVAFDGQNGKIADSSPVMRADCGKKAKRRSGAKKR